MWACSSCSVAPSAATQFLLEESLPVSDLGVLIYLGEYEPDFFAIALIWQTIWEDSDDTDAWVNVLPVLVTTMTSSSYFDWMAEDIQKVFASEDVLESLHRIKSISIRLLTLWFFSLSLGQLEHVVKLIIHKVNCRRDVPITLEEVFQLWSIFNEFTKKGERDGICELGTS